MASRRRRYPAAWVIRASSVAPSESLEAAAGQRTAEANGAAPFYIPFVPERFEDINENTSTFLREGYDYYRTPRGQHPNSKGRFLLTSLNQMLAWSTFHVLPNFMTQPMLLIAGSEADTKVYSDEAYALSNGPRSCSWSTGRPTSPCTTCPNMSTRPSARWFSSSPSSRPVPSNPDATGSANAAADGP